MLYVMNRNPAERLAELEKLLGPQIEVAERKAATAAAAERKQLLAERAEALAKADAHAAAASAEMARTTDDASRANTRWQAALYAAAAARNDWLSATAIRDRASTVFDQRLESLGGSVIADALRWLTDYDQHLCARFTLVPTPPTDGGWRWGRAAPTSLREAIDEARAARGELPALLYDPTLGPCEIDAACLEAARRVGAALGSPELLRSLVIYGLERGCPRLRMTEAAVAAAETGR